MAPKKKKKVPEPGVFGKKISMVTHMGFAARLEHWEGAEPTPMLILHDSTMVYPARDPEGNGPGTLFGQLPAGAAPEDRRGFYVVAGEAPFLIGRTVAKVRTMTAAELEREGWDDRDRPTVLELSDGVILFPSRDEEGNGPGSLFGRAPRGEAFHVAPEGPKEWSPR